MYSVYQLMMLFSILDNVISLGREKITSLEQLIVLSPNSFCVSGKCLSSSFPYTGRQCTRCRQHPFLRCDTQTCLQTLPSVACMQNSRSYIIFLQFYQAFPCSFLASTITVEKSDALSVFGLLYVAFFSCQLGGSFHYTRCSKIFTVGPFHSFCQYSVDHLFQSGNSVPHFWEIFLNYLVSNFFPSIFCFLFFGYSHYSDVEHTDHDFIFLS